MPRDDAPHPALRFEQPHAALADSYRGLVREFLDRGEKPIPFPLSFPNDDFDAFLARIQAHSRGEDVEGFVANTTFWLVRDDVEVVGVSNLRHGLTDALRREGGHIGYGVRPSARRRGFATELLGRTLAEARTLGITQALLTCAEDNEASIGVILRHGGRCISDEWIPERAEVVRRYLVETALPSR